MAESVDILVVGGGLVGASLAIALDSAGRGVTLVEAVAPAPATREDMASGDGNDRNLALARASLNALKSLDVWQHAESASARIDRLHVSRAGEFGATHLSAVDAGVDALGAVVPGPVLRAALEQRLAGCRHLRRLAPARLASLTAVRDGWRARVVTPEGPRDVATRLVVGADGSDSLVRAAVGIGVDAHDYEQSLFACTIVCELDAGGCAFERFSDDGPMALLPLPNRRMGLVLTVPAGRHDEVAALGDDGFAALAQARFGWKLGALSRPGRRFPHRARRAIARSLIAPRAVLVGNAAQTVHPIGAQGFNLGLRDALTLAESVADTDDPGSREWLRAYARRRVPDREAVLAFSHGLVSLACLSQPLFAPLRSLVLAAFDRISPLRRELARRGMGFHGLPPVATLDPGP
jgi:2-octaprenyl-6-methoxyphenol hydroxylase